MEERLRLWKEQKAAQAQQRQQPKAKQTAAGAAAKTMPTHSVKPAAKPTIPKLGSSVAQSASSLQAAAVAVSARKAATTKATTINTTDQSQKRPFSSVNGTNPTNATKGKTNTATASVSKKPIQPSQVKRPKISHTNKPANKTVTPTDATETTTTQVQQNDEMQEKRASEDKEQSKENEPIAGAASVSPMQVEQEAVGATAPKTAPCSSPQSKRVPTSSSAILTPLAASLRAALTNSTFHLPFNINGDDDTEQQENTAAPSKNANNDDSLNISLDSTSTHHDSIIDTPSRAPGSSCKIATPVSTNLRAALMGENSCNKVTSAIKSSNITTTPRAESLRTALMGEGDGSKSMTSTAKSQSNVTTTPRAESLRAALMFKSTTPPMQSDSAAASSSSSTADAPKPSPSASPPTRRHATPIASVLAAQLHKERTPSPDAKSMAALQRDSARIAQRVMSMRSENASSAQETSTSAGSTPPSDAVQTPSPLVATSTSSLNISNTSTPDVARNLLMEMDDHGDGTRTTTLDVSLASLISLDSPTKDQEGEVEQAATTAKAATETATMADVDERSQIVSEHLHQDIQAEQIFNDSDISMDGSETVLANESQQTSPLFKEDEFIPGLSTPAHPASATLSSPIKSKNNTPARRVLTPSKAARLAEEALAMGACAESSSKVVLASVRAHPRDAKKLGSDVFLSPVRRSTRKSSAAANARLTGHNGETAVDAVDQQDLARMLEENNYAYHPNPALKQQLTPIPTTRSKQTTTGARTPASNRPLVSTPIPPRSLSALTGASVVVLQPVRSTGRSRRSGSKPSFDEPVDPSSSSYLLSPVRRSSRHTAPQSLGDLAHLLATTKFAYQSNPLLDEREFMNQIAMGSVAENNEGMEEDDDGDDQEEAVATPTQTARSRKSNKGRAIRSPTRRGATQLDAIDEEQEGQEEDDESADASSSKKMDTLEQMHVNEKEMMMMMQQQRSKRTRSSSRVGTPMPATKKRARMGKADPTIAYDQSCSSGVTLAESLATPSPSSASASSSSMLSKSSNSSSSSSSGSSVMSKDSLSLQKDADGFFIPLAPSSSRSNYSKKSKSKGSKRKAHPSSSFFDSMLLQEKMGANANTASHASIFEEDEADLDECDESYGPSSIPAAAAPPSRRTSTPRPPMKRQKKVRSPAAGASMMEMIDEHTPRPTRRSTRIATPIR